MLKVGRSGNLRARLSATRDGQAAIRLSAGEAALRTGLLELLRDAPATTAELTSRGGWSDPAVLEALLHVLAELGLVRGRGEGWSLTRRGVGLLEDDVARAAYEAFSGYHTGLYREVEDQLGGSPRHDISRHGDVIARLSRAMDPFVLDALDRQVRNRSPRRVLDVGCGTASHLAHLLRSAPGATGVGVETDPAAAALAREHLARAGLDARARVVEGDVREVLGAVPGGFDLAVLANVVYYFPTEDRTGLLRSVAERLEPQGTLMVMTTARTDDLFSRHFDLLLRAQEGRMGLPDMDELSSQLRAAGLVPAKPRRIAVGEPLTAVTATRP